MEACEIKNRQNEIIKKGNKISKKQYIYNIYKLRFVFVEFLDVDKADSYLWFKQKIVFRK